MPTFCFAFYEAYLSSAQQIQGVGSWMCGGGGRKEICQVKQDTLIYRVRAVLTPVFWTKY